MSPNIFVFIILAMQLITRPTCAATLTEQLRSAAQEEAVSWYHYKGKNGNYSAMITAGIRDFILSLTCDPGYAPKVYYPQVICFGGVCPKTLPKCVRQCKLNKQPSLRYLCPYRWDPARECDNAVLSGTTVVAECKDRNYFSPHDLQCVDGAWDRDPICKPECGRVTYEPSKLTPTGDRGFGNLAPWHATVHSKLTRTPVCGGTIISTTVVISAAHCFWDSAVGLLPPAYRVVVGAVNQNSINGLDMYRQQQDVNEIKVPPQFNGIRSTVEYDIALVTVTSPLQWSTFVTPACLDFDPGFKQQQLTGNALGKFVTWDHATGELKPHNLQTVSADACAESYLGTEEMNITNDLICAGVLNGTTKQGQSTAGTGLVFSNTHHGVERFYLRGVASAPRKNGQPIVFTEITKHQNFISS